MEVNFSKLEEKVLEDWRREKTFEKSAERRRRAPRFIFYEGPPTANAGPGIHHVLARVFKDIILRYKTMQGFRVERRAGWDTHGLPVELQIEKKLGLKSKKEIEKYGIAKFNAECKKSVWEYKKEWEELTERIGFWIDMKNSYITYETSYIETLWFIIKTFWQKNLLYKDYKVVPYCTRCGTPLSSHEMALGYRTVKDNSLYIRFEILSKKPKLRDTAILSWTTTPWTLPGNVALAIDPKAKYIRIPDPQNKGKKLILGFENFKNLTKKGILPTIPEKETEILKTSELIGLSYRPLFNVPQLFSPKSFKVYGADFVSKEEGTGIVHTAVMYGEEDFELGKKVNLPKFHTVDSNGRFIVASNPRMRIGVMFNNTLTEGLAGKYVKDPDTEKFIINLLRKKRLLFREELYEHEYPFCWRCNTPLLYYAKESWFVGIRKVKRQLIKNNEEINWVPSHIKKGRMGEWLKDAKDWAFSRERYWGTPLPIWQCKKCNKFKVIGSLKELLSQKFSSNTYYILRHAHSERQLTDVMSCWPEKKPLPLTPQGIKTAKEIAKELKRKNISLIISSDLLRTKQTAEIVGKELGLKPKFDERLREWNVGILNGRPVTELGRIWGRPDETPTEHYLRRFVDPIPKGESWKDVQARMYNLLQDLERKYHNKTILIISHEVPLTLLEATLRGLSRQEIVRFRQIEKKGLKVGEWRKIAFVKLPLNEDMEIDLHRPYVDEVQFYCSYCKEGLMTRVKEVVDVWFDSGAMPFAQAHWPFSEVLDFQSKTSKLSPPKLFPADYIVEGIDQTRGWFYTLLAVSTLLGFGPPYKNVIALSLVLDEKGEKMSKSKGNVVNPWEIIKKYGIDATRWYFFTINNPGDPKLFSEKDIQGTIRKFLLIFWNCLLFYETYSAKDRAPISSTALPKAKNVLDRWVLSRLCAIIEEVSERLDSYDVTGAGRLIESFVVNELSLWYIRRSRARFQNPKTKKEFIEASSVLGFLLSNLAKLSAPFIPFFAHELFRRLGGKESVHLQDWPKIAKNKRDIELEKEMELVRDIVKKALAERAKARIKVRQPLSLLKVKDQGIKLDSEFLNLIKDEVNVKRVVFDNTLKKEVELDTTITPELRKEGMLREILRNIQDLRKEAGYKPKQKATLWYFGDPELVALLQEKEKEISQGAGLKLLHLKGTTKQKFDVQKKIQIENKTLYFSIKR